MVRVAAEVGPRVDRCSVAQAEGGGILTGDQVAGRAGAGAELGQEVGSCPNTLLLAAPTRNVEAATAQLVINNTQVTVRNSRT